MTETVPVKIKSTPFEEKVFRPKNTFIDDKGIAVPFKPMNKGIALSILHDRAIQEKDYERKQREHDEAVKGEIVARMDKIEQQAKKAGIPVEAICFGGCDNEELLQVIRSVKIKGKTIQYTNNNGTKYQVTYGNHYKMFYDGAGARKSNSLLPEKIVNEETNGHKTVSTLISEEYTHSNSKGQKLTVLNAYKVDKYYKTSNGVYRSTYILGDDGATGDAIYNSTIKFYNPQGKEITEAEYRNATETQQ